MPETTDYMVLGYIVVIVILIASVAYLVLKARNQQKELHTLEQLDAEDHAASQQPVRETPREPVVSRETRSSDVPL
jgi:hypothetical protein